MTPRIIYLCPADDVPTGGIKVIYRHAEMLSALGARAFVLHPFEAAFRCTWFSHATHFLDSLTLDPLTDFVVIPELWAGVFGPQCLQQNVRYAVFVQNGYLSHPILPQFSATLMDTVYRGADLVFAISDDTALLVKLNYPGLDPARVLRTRYSVNERFLSSGPSAQAPHRGQTITYMPRKMATHAARVVFALGQHLPPGWQIAPIQNVDEATCATMLFASSIFLAFSDFEGLPLPPLEAALAGDLVIGYTGQGALEYWEAPNFQEIHQGDIRGFVTAAAHAAREIDAARLTRSDLAPGIARLTERFSPAAETANLRVLLDRIERCFATTPAGAPVAEPIPSATARTAENAAMALDLSVLRPVYDYPLTADAVTSRTWFLCRPDGEVLGRHARLLPSGHIGGCSTIDARRWQVIEGQLVFLDAVGRRTVIFDRVYLTENDMLVLPGAVPGAEGAEAGIYLLREREALSRIADDAGDIQVMSSRPNRKRRNLVVLRANEHALHTAWQRDIADEDRNWDLCVSFYGKEENFRPTAFAEYHVLQSRDQKYASIHKLIYQGNPFWDYEYFMFPDDDLMMSWSNINRLFETSQSFGLDLAQPSLLPEGFVYHKVVAQNKSFRLRYTNFVEIMTPIFSRYALEICIPTFATSPRGLGLDFIWPSQLGDPPGRIAIIDEVGVLHGRPVGGNYDIARGNQERIKVMHDYGCTWNIRERGAIM